MAINAFSYGKGRTAATDRALALPAVAPYYLRMEITLYQNIGGAHGVSALCRRFYHLMDTLPEAARCRAIHPADLSGSEAKFYDYLTGYLGGPPVYVDKHGHPRLRSRHFGAEIGPAERDEWLLCFNRALDETIANARLRDLIREPVERLAFHMQNKA